MAAAHGDGFRGGVHGDSVQAIRHYFQQRSCRSCSQPYTPEGIEIIRQEPGVIVVRVGCALCGSPLGIALVGMNTAGDQGCFGELPLGKASPKPDCPPEWTKRDFKRLAEQPPISYDDVLDAHNFFSALGDDWSAHLPKIRRRQAAG